MINHSTNKTSKHSRKRGIEPCTDSFFFFFFFILNFFEQLHQKDWENALQGKTKKKKAYFHWRVRCSQSQSKASFAPVRSAKHGLSFFVFILNLS